MGRVRLFARCLFAAVVLPTAGVSTATAAVITFAGLPGPTDSSFGGITEASFEVAAISGSWFQGLIHGSPTPSIYDGPVSSPGIAAIQLVRGGLPFTFASVDYSSNNGAGTYLIQGFLGLGTVFSQSGPLAASAPPGFIFTTLGSASAATIDRLVIEVSPGAGVTSINLDNINVPEGGVPEPATAVLFIAAFCSLLVRSKHSTHK